MIALAAALLLTAQNESGRWDSSSDGYVTIGRAVNQEVWAVQVASVARNPVGSQTPEVWVRVDYSAVRTERARRGMYLYRLDCRSQSSTVVSATRYAPDGSVLSSGDYPYASYSRAVPGSMMDALLRSVCPR